MLKAFNSSGFKPYSVLPLFPITLEGKMVNVEVEVFDVPLDYNLLLGCSWIDSMHAVMSTLFHIVHFPHQGKVVTVDQLALFNSDTCTKNIPFIAKTRPRYENVGVGLLKYSTLMGMFLIPPPNVLPPLVASINMISTSIHETPTSSDLWIVPEPDFYLHYSDQMPLSPIESAYQTIQSAVSSTPSLSDSSPDPFHIIFTTDEMIMLVILMEYTPWSDGHHHSILFLEQNTLKRYQQISTPSTVVVIYSVPKPTHDVLYEGNVSKISPTIPLDIYIKPGVVENVHIEASCSTDEVVTYKSLFQEFFDIFMWSYESCQVLTLILLYRKLIPIWMLNPSSETSPGPPL
jgi:hypothetical protein